MNIVVIGFLIVFCLLDLIALIYLIKVGGKSVLLGLRRTYKRKAKQSYPKSETEKRLLKEYAIWKERLSKEDI